MKIKPLFTGAIGALVCLGCVLLTGAAHLSTWVGKFYGDGAGMSNVVATAVAPGGLIFTNPVEQWQMDGTFENTLQREGSHGVVYTYDRIDGGSATVLWRTTDGTFHFPNAPYLDGAGFLGNPLGVDPITGQLVPISAAAPVQNFFTTNLFASTNYVDYFNSYSNAFITINTNAIFNQQITVQSNATFNSSLTVQSNLTVVQNISVSGKATLTQVIITNNFLTSTNAFPLAAGTTWDWSKYYQRIITNADFNVTAIGGLSNSLFNQAILQVSNSSASQIICHLQFAMTKFGPLTTNDLYIPAAKMAEIDGNSPGTGLSTNVATIAGQ